MTDARAGLRVMHFKASQLAAAAEKRDRNRIGRAGRPDVWPLLTLYNRKHVEGGSHPQPLQLIGGLRNMAESMRANKILRVVSHS